MFIIVSWPNSTCWLRWMYDAAHSHVSTAVVRVNRPTVNISMTTSMTPCATAISVGVETWNQMEKIGLPLVVVYRFSAFQYVK